jgi:hypothetical protein
MKKSKDLMRNLQNQAQTNQGQAELFTQLVEWNLIMVSSLLQESEKALGYCRNPQKVAFA